MKESKEEGKVSFNSILKNSPSIIAILTFVFGTVILGLFKFISFVADKRYLEVFHISSQFISLGLSETVLDGIAFLGVIVLFFSTTYFYAYNIKHRSENCKILSLVFYSYLVVFSLAYCYLSDDWIAIILPLALLAFCFLIWIKNRNREKDFTTKKENDNQGAEETIKTMSESTTKEDENIGGSDLGKKEEKDNPSDEDEQQTVGVTDTNKPDKQADNWAIWIALIAITFLAAIMSVFPSVEINTSKRLGGCVIPYNGKNYIVIYKTDKLLITEEIEYKDGKYMIYYDRQKIYDSFAIEMEYWDIGDNYKTTFASNMSDHDDATTETNTTETNITENDTTNTSMTNPAIEDSH